MQSRATQLARRSDKMKKSKLLAVGAVLSAAVYSAAVTGQPKPAGSMGPRTDEPPVRQLIVKYRDETVRSFSAGAGKSREAVLSSKSGLAIAYRRPMSGLSHVYALPNAMSTTEAFALAKRLELSDPSIEYAEPDYRVRKLVVPSDPMFATQWHYQATNAATSLLGGINAPLAWDLSRGQGVVVAVLDTGIVAHPDLAANVLPGYDFITDPVTANDGGGRDGDPSDPGDWVAADFCDPGEPADDQSSSWHGTHVAGTIAAVSNNGVGVAGVAYESRVLNVRVLGRCGGATSDVLDAIRWAAGLAVPGVPNNANVAKVINMSLGGTGPCSQATQAAVSAATAAGSLVVAATGNDGFGQIGTPANCVGAVAVTAHTYQGDNANYANVGAGTAISAPGGGQCSTPDTPGVFTCLTQTNRPERFVASTLNSGTTVPVAANYAGYVGTSMATPHVAGVAALLFSRAPALKVTEARFLLTSSARAFPPNTYCTAFADAPCGAGMLDAKAALDLQTGRAPALAVTAPAVTSGGQTISLQATTTSRNGGSMSYTYSWAQTSGPTVTLANPATANPTFTAPSPGGTHIFEATVVDGNGYTVKQTVTTKSNSAPTIAAVGPQSGTTGTPLQVRVTATDPEQDRITWVATGLPAGSTFDAATGTFAWANPQAGAHTFSVVANDGTINSAATTVSMSVQPAAGSSGGGGSTSFGVLWLLLMLLSYPAVQQRRSRAPAAQPVGNGRS